MEISTLQYIKETSISLRKMTNITYTDILLTPEKIVPSLSKKEVKTILIETILAYTEKKIELKTLAKIANSIQEYSSVPLPKKIKEVVDEINSMYVIDDALVDILGELIKK